MAHYVLIDAEQNVVNVIDWDGVSPYAVPNGRSLVPDPSKSAGPGCTYVNGIFVPASVVADPPADLSVPFLQFRSLFTSAEIDAIMSAAQTIPTILDWLLQAAGASSIDLGNPTVKAGLDALVGAGLLTAEREAAILANQPPAT